MAHADHLDMRYISRSPDNPNPFISITLNHNDSGPGIRDVAVPDKIL